jgi:antagonist of KipI
MNEQPTNKIHVIQPGPMTLVQDRGRVGYQQLGVSVGGAADIDALDVGNRLVGNDLDAAGLEVTLGGLVLEFVDSTVFALTGADAGAALDGVPLTTNVSYMGHPGSQLELGMVSSGLRCYVSFGGGVGVPSVLGSRSTHVASEIGGVSGRALVEGDVVEIGDSDGVDSTGLMFTGVDEEVDSGEQIVRVVLGPQDDEFSAAGIETLLSSSYSVTDQSNRQGLRLDGPKIESKTGRYDIVSDAVVNGSIQIPGDGKPIILLADRQTTGGYAKIGTVATVDLPKLGQAVPGTNLAFVAVSVEDAQELLAERVVRIEKTELRRASESVSLRVDGAEVVVEVGEHDGAWLAAIDGLTYPILVDENSPAE